MDLSIRAILLEGDPDLIEEPRYVFKPTKEECQKGLLHICYSSVLNKYIRLSSDDELLDGWSCFTYSYTNFFRKHEWDWEMAYLARHECRGDPFAAEVTWKFDVADTDKKMSRLVLQAPCKLYEDGAIIWMICTEKQNFIQTGVALQEAVTFELDGSTTMTITAFLTGGRKDNAYYQAAQLFRQEMRDKTTYPFQIKLFLESPTIGFDQSLMAESSIEKIDMCYVFVPNEEERKAKSIDISYNSSEDCYNRYANDEKLSSWIDYTYSCTNVALMKDGKSLGTKDGSHYGKVTWKFDTTADGLKLKQMRLRAPTRSSDSDSVVWVICSGKQCYMETGDALDKYMTFELEGSTYLSITVFFSEGKHATSLSQFDIGLTFYEEDVVETETTESENNRVDTSSGASQDSNSGFTFKPTKEEITKKLMHICYSTNGDKYIRKVSSNELYSWQNYTYSWNNLFRKEDNYKWMSHLINANSYEEAEVTWKFDVTDTALKMKQLELRATTTTFEPSTILWTVSTEQRVYKVESLQTLKTFDLYNSSTLTIAAHSEGNQGPNASQLFPQPLDDGGDLPLEVKIHLAHPTHTDASIDATKWRFPKKSFGIPAPICTKVDKCYVFKPTRKDCKNRMMRVSYSPRTDKYKTGTPSSDEITSWLDGTYSSINMYRKEEHDHDVTYLARIEGTQFADVTWKFDVTGTNVEMCTLELTALSALYEDARILWTIRAGDKTFIKTEALFNEISPFTFDLDGALTLTISACLIGGKGLVAWQHSQLFRENMHRKNKPPFQVLIYFSEAVDQSGVVPGQCWIKGNLGLPALTCKEDENNFVFKPTTSEINNGLMHIVYNIREDYYTRKTSKETQSSWLKYTNSCKNIAYTKRREDWEEYAYLSRMDGTQFAEVTWKFDVSGLGLKMSKLELKAICKLVKDGCILWTIKTDDQKFIQTGQSLCDKMTFDLNGSQTLTISALLTGGDGVASAKHARLFCQEVDDRIPIEEPHYAFDVKLFLQLESNWNSLALGGIRDEGSESAELQSFSFVPSEKEIRDGEMDVCLNLAKNVYKRPSIEKQVEVHNWESNIYSSTNMTRVVDREAGITFLAMKKGSECAHVTWKFDLTNTIGVNIASMELTVEAKAANAEKSFFTWRICGDKAQYFFNTGGSMCGPKEYQLQGSKTLTVTAMIQGGKATHDSWKSSCLLLQSGDEGFPLSFRLTLGSDGDC